jgi:AraC family transcriptional regulator
MVASMERRPTFCPDLIRRHSRCDPEYLVRGSGGGNIFAAKWYQPASYVPVREASHSMLCFHAGGSTKVRKLEDGRQVGARSNLGSLTYIPTDGTEWQLDGGIEVVHVYLDPLETRSIAQTLERRGGNGEILPFFSIEDPWLQGFLPDADQRDGDLP